MDSEFIICIPGPWRDKADFIGRVITTEPNRRFMFAGGILADIQQQDHVSLEFCNPDGRMVKAFKTAGQGKDGLKDLKVGSTLRFDHRDVHDWMIVQSSQAWGGFTLRVVPDRMQAQERLQYDEYTGILCYNELE